MNDEEFQSILDQLGKYLATDKTFVNNTFRVTEIQKAVAMATELFPDATIRLQDDPLQMGAAILVIEDYAIGATGTTEINLFSEIIKLADNFEFYSVDDETVRFTAVFQNALVRI